MSVGCQERLLHQVLGISRTSGQPPGDSEKQAGVLLDQFREIQRWSGDVVPRRSHRNWRSLGG